jgi:ATP-dependent helicase HepA
MPLVAWDVLRTTFQPVVNRPGSYFRRAAVTRPDARLFRVGEPLIDALAGYMRWDDRGQTFAFWRPTHYALDDEAFYRFDYLIDAATEETEDLVGAVAERLDPRAIQRRADSHLPPSLETIWTTLEGFEVLDGETLKVLNRPYDPSTGDLNLNSERRWALDQLVGAADWSSRCHLARVKSEGALRSRDDFEAATVAAVVSFEAASRYATIMKRTRLPVLTTRQRVREEEELEIDERIDRALAAGLRSPRVRLDAIGLVVMSRHLPDGPGFPTAKR